MRFWLMGHMPPSRRLHADAEAPPGSVVAAGPHRVGRHRHHRDRGGHGRGRSPVVTTGGSSISIKEASATLRRLRP